MSLQSNGAACNADTLNVCCKESFVCKVSHSLKILRDRFSYFWSARRLSRYVIFYRLPRAFSEFVLRVSTDYGKRNQG